MCRIVPTPDNIKQEEELDTDQVKYSTLSFRKRKNFRQRLYYCLFVKKTMRGKFNKKKAGFNSDQIGGTLS